MNCMQTIRYPMDKSRIHFIEVKDSKFVLDVNSGVFFEIDCQSLEILEKMCSVSNESQLVRDLSNRYPVGEIQADLSVLKRHIWQGTLFSADRFKNYRPNPDLPLSTICLNISHDCNMHCAYCFADRDGYIREKRFMTKETAEQSINFLIRKSKGRSGLEVSFFGGEPLLNFSVLKHTVAYANRKAKEYGKSVAFHVTTNGTLLDAEKLEFLKLNNFSVILSLDGPKEVQDSMRPFLSGKGTYDVVLRNLKPLLSNNRYFRNITIRSTFTRQNLNIDELMMHLASLDCQYISVEPAYTGVEELDIQKEDMNELLRHYDELANKYLNEMANGRFFTFFHIKQMMDSVHRRKHRLSQCGASVGFVAISANGNIYPCHKFVGQKKYLFGNVYSDDLDRSTQEIFCHANVRAKDKCMGCWARYLCGGSCHYLAIQYNDDILKPYDLECEMTKRRIELGIYLYNKLEHESPSMHARLYQMEFPIERAMKC